MNKVILWLCNVFLLSQICLAAGQYLGPYKEIYPYVDITKDQQSCVPTAGGNETCPLYIALMMSFGGDFVSSGVIPGVQLAINQINSDPSILPGYTLHYTLLDSQCERTTALQELHTELLQPPTKIGVIGSGCSVSTEPTAEVSRYYNLTQVSCTSASSELTDRRRFPYHFGILTTDANLAFGFYSIIRSYGWRRVAIFLQDENVFTVTIVHLMELLEKDGVEVDERRFKSSQGIDGLSEPFNSEYRIHIVAMYSSHARQLMCKAYEQGIFYPRYLFLFYGWYADQWWFGDESENLTCTHKDRERVINSGLAIVLDEAISDCSKNTSTGIDGYTFENNVNALLENSLTVNSSSVSIYSQNCYDSTWILALALNESIASVNGNPSLRQELAEFNNGQTFNGLQHFTYNNSGFVNLLFSHLSDTDFDGITGNIRFNASSGVRQLSTIIVTQHQESYIPDCTAKCSCQASDILSIRRERIGTVDFIRNPGVLNVTFSGELWSSGEPYDGKPIEMTETVDISLTVIFIVLSTVGIVFAIICLIFNFIFRKRKLIRLTSPNLNYLIGIGAIIIYIDIYFFVIPSTDKVTVTVFCNLTAWLTAIGYSLCYGTIVAKMFRVFYIFRNPTAKKRKLQDWMLALVVLMFIAVDVIILLVYDIYSATQGTFEAIRMSNRERIREEIGVRGIVYEYFFWFCDSNSRDICLGILYGYKAVLQVIALVFSFSIRKVKIKGLNDAKGIAVAVYVTSTVTAVIIVSFYSLKEYLNVYATLFCLGFFIGTTAILCLIFIPKMNSLFHDPLGEKVFSKSVASHSSNTATGMNKGQPECGERTIASLQNRVKDLELALSKHVIENNGTRKVDDESMTGSMKTSKVVSFSQDKNGQMEEPLPSNGSYHD